MELNKTGCWEVGQLKPKLQHIVRQSCNELENPTRQQSITVTIKIKHPTLLSEREFTDTNDT